MEQIVGVIDMDGFVINKTFYCKELGVLNVGKDEGDSYLFDIGIRWQCKQQKHCMFLTRNIHKLPFAVSRGTNPIPLSNLNTIVKCFYDSVKLTISVTSRTKADILSYICCNTYRSPQLI